MHHGGAVKAASKSPGGLPAGHWSAGVKGLTCRGPSFMLVSARPQTVGGASAASPVVSFSHNSSKYLLMGVCLCEEVGNLQTDRQRFAF
jgi:hypothetical protein